jgi:hypothetical protein
MTIPVPFYEGQGGGISRNGTPRRLGEVRSNKLSFFLINWAHICSRLSGTFIASEGLSASQSLLA